MSSFGKKVAQTQSNLLIEGILTSINYMYCECDGYGMDIPLPL